MAGTDLSGGMLVLSLTISELVDERCDGEGLRVMEGGCACVGVIWGGVWRGGGITGLPGGGMRGLAGGCIRGLTGGGITGLPGGV